MIDELRVAIVPVLLGDGLRLFANLADDQIKLEKVNIAELPGGTAEI